LVIDFHIYTETALSRYSNNQISW